MRASFEIGGYVLLAVGVVVLGSSLLDNVQVSRAANSAIALQPPSQVVQVGEPVKLDIAVSSVTNLAAWEVRIKYDPSVVEFGSFEHTDWLDSTGRSTACSPTSVDAVAGTALMGCGTTGGLTIPGPDGDGIVGHVTLTAKAAGVSNLEITKLSLSNWDSVDCCGPVTADEAVVRVTTASGGGSGDTALPPTPTPNPSKATPTVAVGVRHDPLLGTPVAGTTAPGDPPAGTGATTAPSASGSSTDVAAAAASDIFSGAAQAQTGQSGTSAPHAGTGTLTRVPSKRAEAVATALGLAGLACVLASRFGTLGRFARRRSRR